MASYVIGIKHRLKELDTDQPDAAPVRQKGPDGSRVIEVQQVAQPVMAEMSLQNGAGAVPIVHPDTLVNVWQWDPTRLDFFDKQMTQGDLDAWTQRTFSQRFLSPSFSSDTPPIEVSNPLSLPATSGSSITIQASSVFGFAVEEGQTIAGGKPDSFGFFDVDVEQRQDATLIVEPILPPHPPKKGITFPEWTRFLKGDGEDDKGRYMDTILLYTDQQLEDTHDYIQRIFPAKTASQDPTAPCWTYDDLLAPSDLKEIQGCMQVSLLRMLEFYGFERTDKSIEKSENFAEKRQWLSKQHNFRRISRILESLRLFKLENEAALFQAALKGLYTSGHSNYERNCDKPDHNEYIPPITRWMWEGKPKGCVA